VRRWMFASAVLAAGAVVVLLVQGAAPCGVLPFQPACYVALEPGPVEGTSELVAIEGTPSHGSSGELLVTTIAVDDELGFVEWITAVASPVVDAVPRQRIYPPDVDPAEIDAHNAALMEDSQLTATIAALSMLGYELEGEGARVASVAEDAVTDDLRSGDVIFAVDGEPVSGSGDVVAAVRGRSPGESVELHVLRDGTSRTFAVRLGSSPDDPDLAYVGVMLITVIELPVDVRIDAGVIGGPSAGLMFALSILDQLEADDLTGGAVIAGTGTVDREGVVGTVGGVRQKLVAATDPGEGQQPASVFLVPAGNLDEASRAPVVRDVLLVPVGSLEDALEALTDLGAGRRPGGALALDGSGTGGGRGALSPEGWAAAATDV